MELWYPVKDPINQQNLFGANAAWYQEHLAQNGHPGIDFECPLYTPIYAPCEGDAFYASDKYHGDGIYIRVPNNGRPQANIILWHLPDRSDTKHWVIPSANGVVTHVKAGQLIGYTGNSGYPQESSGPHLHVGYLPCDFTGAPLNPNNGFGGCVDPMPFFNGKFAQDYATAEQALQTAQQVIASPDLTPIQKIQTANAIVAFIRWLFNWK